MKTGVATRCLAIVPLIALAMVTMADTSAVAAGVTITDDSGVDFDAACAVQDPQAATPPPNNVTSPGNPGGSLGLPVGGDGCDGVSLYDGSTESTDIREVSLASNGVAHESSSTQLVASCTFDHPIPAAGSTALPVSGVVDFPSTGFQRAGCKVMFQNLTRQTNSPSPYSCLTVNGLNEHWGDGFHFFIGFDVTWNGLWWVHSASIGTYDPSPTGGFLFQELGWSTGSWRENDYSNAWLGKNWDVSVSGSTATVTVDGVLSASNAHCVGAFETVYARAGDSIVNVKGVSTAEHVVALPVAAPTDDFVLGSDILAVGGFIVFSDTTQGVSRNGGLVGGVLLPGKNIAGIAYTPGPAQRPVVGTWLGVVAAPTEALGGVVNMPDTLGPGPRCWTYTFGGRLPRNPLWVPDEPCHIDDDNIPHPNGGNIDPGERGTFLPEFWGTPYGFVA